ncbi:MAG: hypothetical protein K5893_07370 [Prevotella sp.]|nr:hypothetical protein [Prevotella sp.]
MSKRNIDRTLSEGHGKQLIWLVLLIAVVIVALLIYNWLFVGLKCLDILPSFFGIGASGEHRLFKLIAGLIGRVLFSAVLISIFVKIFDNMSNSYRNGESVYPYKDHILIIGAGRPLKNMLLAIKDNKDFEGKDILVMTAIDVITLRRQMKIELADSSFCKRLNYFHRERHTLSYLADACADKASAIYIIGEDNEIGHDSLNMRCLNHLKEVCKGDGPTIPCYIIMQMHTTLSVFNYIKTSKLSRLNVEVINELDYSAERLMTGTNFLPAFTVNDTNRRLHLAIVGNTDVSRSFAMVAAQLCHFPNYNKEKTTRTKISLIGYGVKEMNSFTACYRNMFDLCHYRYLSSEKTEEFIPKNEYGDFMDIEWEFIDSQLMSPYTTKLIESWVDNPSETLAMAMCFGDDETNAYMALHLPHIIYNNDVNVAVSQNGYTEVMKAAISTGMYGNIFLFGNSVGGGDPLFLQRSAMGKRVNRVYDLEYGNPPANDESEAWEKLPYAHKYSSIASANSIVLKLRSLQIDVNNEKELHLSDADLYRLSELEHRRWMTTMLFMGYRAATISERKDRSRFNELKNEQFIHLDIAPYEELPGELQKDMLIINNIPYIITGKKN